MEVNKIQEELARLIELVDGWAGSHDVPGIERDLVLDKLKKLYEAIRFANFDEGDSSASASVAAQQSVAEVAPVSEISIDLVPYVRPVSLRQWQHISLPFHHLRRSRHSVFSQIEDSFVISSIYGKMIFSLIC